MMYRITVAILIVFTLACGGLEIVGGQPSKTAAQQAPIQTDLRLLRGQVRLPKAATSCRFKSWRKYTSPRIGPSQIELVGWVALSSMDELDAMFGTPLETTEPYRLEPDLTDLIPPEILATLERDPNGIVLLPGNYRRPPYKGDTVIQRVIEVADAGILIWEKTM
jgi:hypothetical protein